MTFRLPLLALAVFTCGHLRADTLLPADRPMEQVVDHYIDAALKELKSAKPVIADSLKT